MWSSSNAAVFWRFRGWCLVFKTLKRFLQFLRTKQSLQKSQDAERIWKDVIYNPFISWKPPQSCSAQSVNANLHSEDPQTDRFTDLTALCWIRSLLRCFRLFFNCDVNPISREMETFGLQSVSSIGLVRMDRILLKKRITWKYWIKNNEVQENPNSKVSPGSKANEEVSGGLCCQLDYCRLSRRRDLEGDMHDCSAFPIKHLMRR